MALLNENACPKGGIHEWQLADTWEGIEFPPGVDACTENLIFANQIEYRTWSCDKCGEMWQDSAVVSTGIS